MTNLTIGLPVYNAMPFLKESMESLLRQTDPDFTILAINDGSTDASLDYLLSVQDPRLRVVTQPNRGLTFTLNRMLREVDTPWLMRHDADDVALAGRVECTRRSIAEFSDAGMFYAEARYYQEGKNVGTFRTTRAAPEKLREIAKSGYLLAICHPTVTLNVDKATALGGYRFDLNIEDIDLWWRMALKYDVRYIPETTTYFRHNSTSVSASNLEYQSINTLFVQYLLLSHLHERTPLSYDSVHAQLAYLVDRAKLRFREQMRHANIYYAQGARSRACKHLVNAALACPSYFASRVLYELREKGAAVNGEDPSVFLKKQEILWPKTGQLVPSSQSALTF